MLNNQQKETVGAWVQAVGTILSAISSTPHVSLPRPLLTDLDLWGNVLQAIGNALEADSETSFSLNKLGSEIEAIGNSTVITGIVIDFNQQTKTELYIKGNLLQALGAGTSLTEILGHPPSKYDVYSVIGYLMQATGNLLQAAGGTKEEIPFQPDQGKELRFIGSWIQAAGANLSALAVQKQSGSNES